MEEQENSLNKVIIVAEEIGPEALSERSGRKLFEIIDRVLEKGGDVHLNFEGIVDLDLGFIHEAIGPLYKKYSENLIKERLNVSNLSLDDKPLFKNAVEKAKYYYQGEREKSGVTQLDGKFPITPEFQKAILRKLFDFEMDENGVIYDSEGEEFFGFDKNEKFSFDTLEGIVEYARHIAYENGQNDIRMKFRDLLEIK